jgi:hypothetical protein
MSTSSRYENSLSLFISPYSISDMRGTYGILINPKTNNPIFLFQFLPQVRIKIKDLRMDWVCKEYFSAEFSFQKFPDGIGIFGFEEVPYCASWLTVWAGGGVEHDIYCVCYIHVESGSVVSFNLEWF